jgi:hypothetical protein
MSFEVSSTNPVVRAVISGTAPRPAQVAAARGILPLPQNDLLEILVALAGGADVELAQTAQATLDSQDQSALQGLFASNEAAPRVLDFFSRRDNLTKENYDAILTNPNTPDTSIVNFVRHTSNGELLELVSLNQQLLIQNRAILEAIISNPYRTAEAERRAQEIKREFFEKERGARQIAGELRARGKTAAAEFIEQADFADHLREVSSASNLSFEDVILLAEHIESDDSEIDDSWLSLEYIEDIYEETEEQRAAVVSKILGDLQMEENDEITGERVAMINRIMRMNMRDRMKLAMKGDREARTILIRDPNRIVANAVVNNPKITENEVEKIATMRTVPEEVLRQIAISRQWSRSYTIAHNLARNPRTPMANVISILTRLQLRDLTALSKNRNVSDAVRRQAFRLSQARAGR